jgi:mannonate dehydratase
MKHSDDTLQVFRTSYSFEDGLLHPGDNPGLGVEYDDERADSFEYSPAYLPVNRLQLDGSMHDW